MSIDADEIESYLNEKKDKPLKHIELSQDVNQYDQGSNSSNGKIGQKNLQSKQDLEKALARMNYISERNKKLQVGDPIAINEYVAEQNEIRERLQAQRERSRLEYDLNREEEQLNKKLSKITDLDRKEESEAIEKLERRRDSQIANIQDYFNCSEEFWSKWLSDRHTADESPAGALIARTDNGKGYCCTLHKYQNVIESPTNDGRLIAGSFTIEPVENHFRKDPKPHLEALIGIINEKYSKLIEARKEKTLEDPDIKFKREVRDIDSIKTRPGGDYGLLNSGIKLTKGQKARLREAEEADSEKNRKIYRGLYS